MKKWFKYIGYTVVTIAILIMVVILYWGRDQNINFLSRLPKTFNYCNVEIKKNNKAYIELASWLENNKNGWSNSPAYYIPTTLFKSELISINILKTSVVINYSNNGTNWHQVIKGKKRNELLMACKNS